MIWLRKYGMCTLTIWLSIDIFRAEYVGKVNCHVTFNISLRFWYTSVGVKSWRLLIKDKSHLLKRKKRREETNNRVRIFTCKEDFSFCVDFIYDFCTMLSRSRVLILLFAVLLSHAVIAQDSTRFKRSHICIVLSICFEQPVKNRQPLRQRQFPSEQRPHEALLANVRTPTSYRIDIYIYSFHRS